MHLLYSLVIAIMALFPGVGGEGIGNLKAWMEAYETRLYAQMYDNIENARRNEEICKNSAKNEVLHEQTASEEAAVTNSAETIIDETLQQSSSAPIETRTEVIAVSEVETVVESPPPVYPLYAVNGAVLDEPIQTYLYQRLCEAGIGWFFPYAVMIAYQESRFDIYAVNPRNGLDTGLFQYRSTYWNYGDIFSPYDQINVFTIQMAQRANVGCTISDMISRHKQSDWGPYDQEYVNQVLQHQERTVQIR